MSISPLAMAAKKVIDAAFVNGPAYDLASVAAFALESAQLLQDPETAAAHEVAADAARRALAVAESSVALMKRKHAENARLRAELREATEQVAALLQERHRTNEWADDAAEALRANRDRIAELEQVRAAHFSEAARLLEAAGYDDDAVNLLDNMANGIRTLAAEAQTPDAMTRLLAPTQALREDEDPCHPCGCPKRFARHADGCPTYTPATGCGDGPDQWCPGCSACKCEPHTKGCVKASAPR